ncbi:MAG TPA: cupredoxin domain-containing protein [Actinomycetota bacterium]|jgi:plastocyanin|nr:cupredoxin domain-containing protein [Actinomycetota bacterium]
MRTSTRDRVVLPILLPIVMLLVIAAVLFGFSRILLSLTADAATAIALIVALSIMVVAAVVASRSVVRASSLASMLGAIAGVAMLAGGIALIAVGTGGEKEGGGSGGPVTISLTAKGIAFDKTKLSVPAGQPFAIAFDNQDAGIQHDVQIFDNERFTGTPLLNGEIVTGPAKVTYEAPALDPGKYFFHCSVHPAQMHGTIDATAGAPGGGGAKVTVAAQGLQFDTDRIELPAAPSIIHFENDDPGIQHNIAIFTDSSLGTNLFRGEIVTGPAAIDYRIPPLEPGTYYFHCDVHPTMSGTVVVKKGGGGPPPPTATPGGGVGGGGGGGTANPSTITAQGLAFSTAEIALPPDAPSTIHFEDKDAGVSHNIAIYTDSSLGTNLFKGQIITGPASIDYSIPALKPGTYYFHCDVHPTMHGSVTVG